MATKRANFDIRVGWEGKWRLWLLLVLLVHTELVLFTRHCSELYTRVHSFFSCGVAPELSPLNRRGKWGIEALIICPRPHSWNASVSIKSLGRVRKSWEVAPARVLWKPGSRSAQSEVAAGKWTARSNWPLLQLCLFYFVSVSLKADLWHKGV